ncbi:hypothetical protein K6H11_000019 [Candida tropicalis]
MKFSTTISFAILFAATVSAGLIDTVTTTQKTIVTITDTDCETKGTDCPKHKTKPISTTPVTTPVTTPATTPATTPVTTPTTKITDEIISIPHVSQETDEVPGFTILPLGGGNGNSSIATGRTPPVVTFVGAGSSNKNVHTGAFALAVGGAIALLM